MDSEMSGRHRERDYRANFRRDPGKILVPGNLGGKACGAVKLKLIKLLGDLTII